MKLGANVVALAIDGKRVAYAVADNRGFSKGKPTGHMAQVHVWNVRSGTTKKVSKRIAMSDVLHIVDVAIAGSRVAWLSNTFGNTENDNYLFTSSALKQTQKHVATALRFGDACGAGASGGPEACAGPWLGGVVRSGNRILINRWTTDDTGALTDSGLYALGGTTLQLVAAGTGAGDAVAADSRRVALLRPDGTVSLYSTTGTPLVSVMPGAQADRVALSGRNLVVLERGGTLALYDARTGSLRHTFNVHGNPDLLLQRALAVHGNIAVYSAPVRHNGPVVSVSAIRAVNLANGKDREVGRLHGQITVAAVNSTGVVYAADGLGVFGPNELVFVSFKQVAAAVS